jgi:hypothetical protein
MLLPLSSHVYTVEKEKPYPTVTCWTEEYTSSSYMIITKNYEVKTTITDAIGDGSPWCDIEALTLERKGDVLHIYFLMNKEIDPSQWAYYVAVDLDKDGFVDYTAWCYGATCELTDGSHDWDLDYTKQDNVLHIEVPLRMLGYPESFYVRAGVGAWKWKWLWSSGQYYIDFTEVDNTIGKGRSVPLVSLGKASTTKEVFYNLYTSTFSSVYALTSTETHTLTEKVPLSYWHGWLPYWLFAGASAAVIALYLSAVIPYVKSRRKKAKPVVALPEGARLVKLCPSCGTENPLEAEYCLECGARL